MHPDTALGLSGLIGWALVVGGLFGVANNPKRYAYWLVVVGGFAVFAYGAVQHG